MDRFKTMESYFSIKNKFICYFPDQSDNRPIISKKCLF